MDRKILIQTVELQLGRKKVNIEDRFFEDLGAESFDMVNLVVAIESLTGIFIPEDFIPELKTVQDLENYIISLQQK